ncbi:MAG TPA: ExeM/NucH family extracellular endonuclease, partial [Opitutaceae bacterium]
VISTTVSGLTWAPGEILVLRWTDVDDSGSDDGIAIDDLTFSTPADQEPAVAATAPADGAVNVPPNASLTITFNMPVLVTSGAFSVTGSVTGAHPPTVSGGPIIYTLSPATPFAEGETVTTTVYASQIVDTATGTAHPSSDYTFAFTVLTTAPVPIHTVQGASTTSSHVGQVVTIEGVVTASFQGANGLGGYYVQTPESDYDADEATSEGMFVFDNSNLVAAGDLVSVTGTVAEFGTAPTTQTELTSVVYVEKLGAAPLPAPVTVNLPFASVTAAERYEGMRVTLPQTLTVTDNYDLGRYGELILSLGRLPTPTNVVSPGLPAQAQDVANFLNQILVDDGVGPSYPDPTPYLADSAGRGLTRRAGSTVTGVTGILDEKFSSYIIEPTAALRFTDANPRGDPPAVGGALRVALSNVLNFFNGDGAGSGFPTARGATNLEEYQRQRAKLIAGITQLAPDIMGLTEVENDGFGPTSALADLVAGLNAAAPAGTTYAFVDASAIDNGSDLIHNAFIYRVETVALVGAPAALSNSYFTGLARPPLAQTFRERATGEVLTVCVNHFRAKGSVASSAAATDGISPNPNLDTGDGQGTNNYLRLREAQTLVEWLATDPTGSGDPDVLIIGDLNAYAKEDPIVAITDADYINLAEHFEGEGGYSYSFNGEFGHLDHALASPHLAAQVAGASTWHANSDEPAYLDYNTENKSTAQLPLNTGTPFRYADHDPVVVGLALQPDPYAPTIVTQPESQSATVGDTVTFFVEVDAYPAPTYQWFKDGAPIPGATSATLTLTDITLTEAGDYTVVATNSAGSATSAVATLTIRDVTAPVITNLKASPSALWPVTYRMAPVKLTATVTDDADPAPVTRIISVTSSEPAKSLGDITPVDWEITGAMTLKLRAEVSLLNWTRVYMITVESRDASGNASTAQVKVTAKWLP